MKKKLDLITGRPEIGKQEIIHPETGAIEQEEIKVNTTSYTRFTLPFAFQLQAIAKKTETNTLFYELDNKDDLSYIKRRKYFTRETADTLYQQGQWLSVCNQWEETSWGKAEITVSLRDQNFKIGMLAPKLILFETPKIKHQADRNILQTGLLYVDIYFAKEQAKTPQIDDLLVLNEYFRYFGIQNDFHAGVLKSIFANIPINPQKNETIATLDSLACYFERWATLLEIPIKQGEQYFQLFPSHWAQSARDWMYNKPGSQNKEHWQIYADNRCFVWTAAFIDDGVKALRNTFEPLKEDINARDYGHWVKLLNVDTPSFDYNDHDLLSQKDTHQSVSQFERQWADERTYKRWQHSGSLFGFCYHGAAILAPKLDYIFSPSATYYYDTTALLFYIRMSLFRFGRELSKIIQIQDQEMQCEKLRTLRKQFSRFTVLYRFPMPSNQQQSIEMYTINRKYFDLDQFFVEIQQEIDNTHEFLETVESNRLASAANKLADWGLPLAAAGLATALFSMSDLNIFLCNSGTDCHIDSDWILQLSLVSVVFACTKAFMIWKKNN